MAKAFNLTAQINLQGPTNIKPIVADIRRQLGTVSANVNIKVSPQAAKSIDSVNARLKVMNETLVKARANAANLSSTLSGLSSSLGSIGSNGNKTATAIANTANSAKVASKNIKEASTEMQQFGKQAYLAVKRFAAFTFVTTGIFALTNAISGGLKAFVSFDKELVKLQQVTGKGAIGLQKLEDQISRLATSLGVSSESLISVASTLAQAGLNAEETRIALSALAKTELAPSFDNLTDTTEGAIAALRQFELQAGDLEAALGSINAVAAAFAVESRDIITAIQRTGGVFAAASKGVSEGTDALNEFIAVFTSVRATTRESAETIATGLRTIFTRIQRGKTIEALKEYGIILTDLEGKFVGPYEAVKRLSEGLKSLDPRDLRFSQIIEELGGFRQIGKVIPLIQQFGEAQKALKVAQTGQSSLTDAQIIAQKSLANQIAKVREQFLALIRDFGKSATFQAITKVVLGLASALISVTSAFKPILPFLAILATMKGVKALGEFGSGFFGSMKKGSGSVSRDLGSSIGGTLSGAKSKEKAETTSRATDAIKNNTDALKSLTSSIQSLDSTIKSRGSSSLSNGGKVLGFNSGGMVPGNGGGDTVPAFLEGGEIVMNRKAVRKYGANNLLRMNKYSWGGRVSALSKYFKSLPGIPGYEDIKDQYISDTSKFIEVTPENLTSKDKDTWTKSKLPRWKKFEYLLSRKYKLGPPQDKQQFAYLDFPSHRAESKFMKKGSVYSDPDSIKGNNAGTIAGKNFLFANSKGTNTKPKSLEYIDISNTPVTTYWADPEAFEKVGLKTGGKIQKFVGGGKALGARSKIKQLDDSELSQLSTKDLIAYAKAQAYDIFSTSGAGMAIASEFIEVPQERIIPELESSLVSYMGKKGFWREKVAPFGQQIQSKIQDNNKLNKQQALEAQVSRYSDEVAAREQNWTAIRSGSDIDNYLLSKLQEPILSDYKTVRGGGSLGKQFHNTRLRKAVNEALENYDNFDYSSANIDKLVSAIAAKKFASGGMIQRFPTGSTGSSGVQPVINPMAQNILDKLDDAGGSRRARELLTLPVIEQAISKIQTTGKRPRPSDVFDKPFLKSSDATPFLSTLSDLVDQAIAVYRGTSAADFNLTPEQIAAAKEVAVAGFQTDMKDLKSYYRLRKGVPLHVHTGVITPDKYPIIDELLEEQHMSQVKAAKKFAPNANITPLKKEDRQKFGEANLGGYNLEAILALLGSGNGKKTTQDAIDFANGLTPLAAGVFGVPSGIPTQAKLSVTSSNITKALDGIIKTFASGGKATRFISSKTPISKLSSGGSVPAMVSNGEAYVSPKLAKKIGYAKLNKMNQADRNGMKGFVSGGMSVFKGPGSGTSDSIGPIGLPQGSFIIREKATKALGLKNGGGIGIQKFKDGKSPAVNLSPGLDQSFLQKAMVELANSFRSTRSILDSLDKEFESLGKPWEDLLDSLELYAYILSSNGLAADRDLGLMAKSYIQAIKSLQKSGATDEEIVKVKTQWISAIQEETNKAKDFLATGAPSVPQAAPAKVEAETIVTEATATQKTSTTNKQEKAATVNKSTDGGFSELTPEMAAKVKQIQKSTTQKYSKQYKAAPSIALAGSNDLNKEQVKLVAQAEYETAAMKAIVESIELTKDQRDNINKLQQEITAKYQDEYNSATDAADKAAIKAKAQIEYTTQTRKAIFGSEKPNVATPMAPPVDPNDPKNYAVNVKSAQEQQDYFARKAEKAGLSVGGYKYNLAQQVGEQAYNIQQDQKFAKQEAADVAIGKQRQLQGLGAKTGADFQKLLGAGAESKEAQAAQAAIAEFTVNLQKIAPNMKPEEIKAAATEMAQDLATTGKSFEEIIAGSKKLTAIFNTKITDTEARKEAIKRVSESAGISEETIKANVSEKAIKQQAFIQSKEGQRFGSLAQFAPGLTEKFSKTGFGQALGKGADFISGKGGRFSKAFAGAGGFQGIGSGIAVASEGLKNSGLISKQTLKDPNAAGAFGALQGAGSMAAAGAQLGSFAGPIGTLIGGVGGAIIGGIKGFFDAKNAQILNNALENLAKSSEGVDIAFKELAKNDTNKNFKNVQKAFGQQIEASQKLDSIAFGGAEGPSATSIGGGALAGAGAGALGGALIAGPIGAAIGGALGGLVGGATAYMSASQNRANQEEALRGRVGAAGANVEGATRMAERQMGKMTTEQLGQAQDTGTNLIAQQYKESAIAAAEASSKTGMLTAKQKEKISQDATQTAYLDAYMKMRKEAGATDQQIAEDILKDRKSALEAGKKASDAANEAALKQQLLARASKEVAIATENLLDVYRRVGAKAQRFSDEIDDMLGNTQATINSLGGKASVQKVDRSGSERILGNMAAYTSQEVKAATQEMVGKLGGGQEAQALGKQAEAAKFLQDKLPGLLKNTENDPQDVINTLRDQMGEMGIGGDAVDKMLEEIQKQISNTQESGLGTLADEISAGGIDKFSATAAEAAKVLQNLSKTYNDALQKSIDLQNQYNEIIMESNSYLRKAGTIRINAELDLAKALGNSPTLEQLNQPFDFEIRDLTKGLVPGGTTDPAQIAAGIVSATAQNEQLAQANANIGNQGMANATSGEAGAAMLAEQQKNIAAMGANSVAINEGRQALEKLANDGTKAANALAKIEEQQRQIEGLGNRFEKIFTATPEELFKMNTQSLALEAAQTAGSDMFKSRAFRQDAFAGLEQDKEFLSTEEYRKQRAMLMRKSFEAQGYTGQSVINKGGVNMTVDEFLQRIEGGISEEDPNVKAYREAVNTQIKANEELARLNELQALKIQESMIGLQNFLAQEFPKILTDAIKESRADSEIETGKKGKESSKNQKDLEKQQADAKAKDKEISDIDSKIAKKKKELLPETGRGAAMARKMNESTRAEINQLEEEKKKKQKEKSSIDSGIKNTQEKIAEDKKAEKKAKEDQAIAEKQKKDEKARATVEQSQSTRERGGSTTIPAPTPPGNVQKPKQITPTSQVYGSTVTTKPTENTPDRKKILEQKLMEARRRKRMGQALPSDDTTISSSYFELQNIAQSEKTKKREAYLLKQNPRTRARLLTKAERESGLGEKLAQQEKEHQATNTQQQQVANQTPQPVPSNLPKPVEYTRQVQNAETGAAQTPAKPTETTGQLLTLDPASLEGLNTFNTNFATYVDKLVGFQFPTIPEKIEMIGNHVVDVRVTGAAAFESLQDGVKKMINSAIDEKMGQIWTQTNGALGTRPGTPPPKGK